MIGGKEECEVDGLGFRISSLVLYGCDSLGLVKCYTFTGTLPRIFIRLFELKSNI